MSRNSPLSCPGRRFSGFQPSTFTSSDPHTFPFAALRLRSANMSEITLREHSRVKVPYHDDSIVAPARQPPAGMRPPHCQNGSGVHCKGAQRLWGSSRLLGSDIEDRLCAPYPDFRVQSPCSYTRPVRVNMAREDGERFGLVSKRSICHDA